MSQWLTSDEKPVSHVSVFVFVLWKEERLFPGTARSLFSCKQSRVFKRAAEIKPANPLSAVDASGKWENLIGLDPGKATDQVRSLSLPEVAGQESGGGEAQI